MKMSPTDFANLKADFFAMVDALQKETGKPLDYSNKAVMWTVYWLVWDDREYDDSHPRYQVHPRRLPCEKGRLSFYDKGLADSHIETALKKIVAS